MVRSSGVRIARHHAACRTVDTKPRRGILADDPVSDRFGRRRCLRPLRGCGKGGAVEFLGEVPFVRTERWGIGGFRYHWLCSMFRTLSQPLPVPKNGTFSLSRAQSRTCSGYAGAGKRRTKFNDFSAPHRPCVGAVLRFQGKASRTAPARTRGNHTRAGSEKGAPARRRHSP